MAQANPALETLKQKYQSVLNLIQQLQGRVLNVNMQGNKLLIRGTAPSIEVKDKIWDQIKLVDEIYPDLICDISVEQHSTPATMTAGAVVGGGDNRRRYRVKPGDTLSKISREFYGDPNGYHKIFNANRDVLHDPDTIRPGQELVIPD